MATLDRRKKIKGVWSVVDDIKAPAKNKGIVKQRDSPLTYGWIHFYMFLITLSFQMARLC